MARTWFAVTVVIGVITATLCAQEPTTAPPATSPAKEYLALSYNLNELMVLTYSAAQEPDLVLGAAPATMPATVSEPQAQRIGRAVKEFLRAFDPDGIEPMIEREGQTLRVTHTSRSHELLRAEIRNRSIRIGVEARFISTSKVLNDWVRVHGGEDGIKWEESGDAELWPIFPDQAEVERLLASIQEDADAVTVTAPRMTLFNEQQANVTVSTETAYIESLTPIFGINAVAFDPHVGIFNSGVALQFRASLIGNGRDSIEIGIGAKLTRLLDLQAVPLTILSGTQPVTGYYQVPIASVADGNTVITLPAGRGAILRKIPEVSPPDPARPPENPVFLLIHPTILTAKEHP